MTAKQHILGKAPEATHVRVNNSTEGGACLDGRCYGVYAEHSCSYRYQGIKAAEGYKERYNFPHSKFGESHFLGKIKSTDLRYQTDYKDGTVKTVEPPPHVVVVNPIQEFSRPAKERLANGKPNPAKMHHFRKYKCLNFTLGSHPWKNQVHHVIPHKKFRDIKNSFVHIRALIEADLYDKKYNINHKNNMVILPATSEWAKYTGLPIHNGSHGSYDKEIEPAIEAAFRPYKEIEKQVADGCCENTALGKSIHDDLIEVSKEWYTKIMAVDNKNKCKQQMIRINDVS